MQSLLRDDRHRHAQARFCLRQNLSQEFGSYKKFDLVELVSDVARSWLERFDQFFDSAQFERKGLRFTIENVTRHVYWDETVLARIGREPDSHSSICNPAA